MGLRLLDSSDLLPSCLRAETVGHTTDPSQKVSLPVRWGLNYIFLDGWSGTRDMEETSIRVEAFSLFLPLLCWNHTRVLLHSTQSHIIIAKWKQDTFCTPESFSSHGVWKHRRVHAFPRKSKL